MCLSAFRTLYLAWRAKRQPQPVCCRLLGHMLTLLMVGDGPDHIDVLESTSGRHLRDHMLVAVRKTHGTYTIPHSSM